MKFYNATSVSKPVYCWGNRLEKLVHAFEKIDVVFQILAMLSTGYSRAQKVGQKTIRCRQPIFTTVSGSTTSMKDELLHLPIFNYPPSAAKVYNTSICTRENYYCINDISRFLLYSVRIFSLYCRRILVRMVNLLQQHQLGERFFKHLGFP